MNERDDHSLAAFFSEMSRAGLAMMQGMQATPQRGGGVVGADMMALQQEFAARHAALWQSMLGRQPGESGEPVVRASPGDRRFSAPQWSESPFHDYLRQAYLLNAEYAMRAVEALPQADARSRGRLLYMTRQVVDALAPSNFAATNPEFIQTALDTGGESITRGIANLLADLDKGRISMTDESAFEVGRNLAMTPGTVIHENELMQLIQYAPATARVAARPLLIVPPCINKYYILDLSPENSFVRFVVEQGFTVFMISWKSAGESQAQLRWDDYVASGVLEALDVVRDISRISDPNVLGFCIGGTLLASALAVGALQGRGAVASVTLMTTLLDFEEAGELGCLVDEATLAAREQAIGAGGVMRGAELAGVFASLRANDLIWQYVVGNYLKGNTPQAFDLLYWNADSTNLPGPFVTWYLRNMYLDNALREPGRLRILDTPVDLGLIDAPAYLLATAEDHIVPWRGAYASRALLGGETCFVLGASGHIAGAINPASRNRRSYRVGEGDAADAQTWLERSEERPGSWWLHWMEWLRGFAGKERAAPRKAGNARFRPVEAAPGRYVKERA
ncbi:MAG: class I poly(R)-hydroxyalkanoic acid synthase [Pseudazoarcus pumilus]|nr:class I poly(R)-hydroxyalkanoic acid synthase [Pseudazoarcus pumilus]